MTCDCAARLTAIEQRLAALEAKRTPAKHGTDWLAELKANPLFKHVDFAAEERKIAIWKLKPANANRQITKRFWLNWLAKVDTPVPVTATATPQPKAMRPLERTPEAQRQFEPPPPGWLEAMTKRIGKSM